MNNQRIPASYLGKQVDVPLDETGLRYDPDSMACTPGKHFQNRSRDLRASLNWLIGVGCRANCNLVRRIDLAQLLLQQPRSILFDEDSPLKCCWIAETDFTPRAGLAWFSSAFGARNSWVYRA